MNATKQLNIAQFLFEPRPPSSQSCTQHQGQSPTTRRRVQSAKERKGTTSRLEHIQGRRPRSAVFGTEKKDETKTRHRPPSARDGRPPPKQFLQFEGESVKVKAVQRKTISVTQSESKMTAESRTDSKTKTKCQAKKKEETKKYEILPKTKESLSLSSIPSGIAALTPWLTSDVPQEWIGVDPSSCFVFLPSLSSCSISDLPIVPPPQLPHDDLPHKILPKTPEPFNPKKLFHYDVEKNRPSSSEHVCDHKRKEPVSLIHDIFGPDGKLFYDERRYQANRTEEMIQREIDDLEKMLEGIGREDSMNPMVQYQYDINLLQKSVKETLAKCNNTPDTKEEPPDLMGLRAYLKEKERIISRIRARRAQCLQELETLESEFDFSIRVEVNNNPKAQDKNG